MVCSRDYGLIQISLTLMPAGIVRNIKFDAIIWTHLQLKSKLAVYQYLVYHGLQRLKAWSRCGSRMMRSVWAILVLLSRCMVNPTPRTICISSTCFWAPVYRQSPGNSPFGCRALQSKRICLYWSIHLVFKGRLISYDLQSWPFSQDFYSCIFSAISSSCCYRI